MRLEAVAGSFMFRRGWRLVSGQGESVVDAWHPAAAVNVVDDEVGVERKGCFLYTRVSICKTTAIRLVR